jgi:hypothetical protein
MNTPTTGVSKLLDRLIRPLFDKRIRSTTVFDGVVTDLYTKLPQEESLNGLTEFLLEHGYHKVKGVPIIKWLTIRLNNQRNENEIDQIKT